MSILQSCNRFGTFFKNCGDCNATAILLKWVARVINQDRIDIFEELWRDWLVKPVVIAFYEFLERECSSSESREDREWGHLISEK